MQEHRRDHYQSSLTIHTASENDVTEEAARSRPDVLTAEDENFKDEMNLKEFPKPL